MQFFGASEVATVKKVEEEARQFVEEMRKKLQHFQEAESEANVPDAEDDDNFQEESRVSTPDTTIGGGDLDNLDDLWRTS